MRIKRGQRVADVLKSGQKVVNVWINLRSKCGQCVKERSMSGQYVYKERPKGGQFVDKQRSMCR